MDSLPKKLQNALKRAVRTFHQRSPEYKELLDSVKENRKNPETNRMCNFYLCTNCSDWVKLDNIVVEHMVAIELQGYNSIEDYYILMTDLSNCKPFCKPCAKAKDKIDKKLIKERRK